uniref:G2/mitotic-specific cyclin-B3-like n=2 Tax=Hirondellea gigas TaxID=1518452 RepID=A0A2P2I6B5_9CRUS
MNSRIGTRSTRASSSTINGVLFNKKSLSMLGVKGNNENITRPPPAGKGITTLGIGGLKDASNKQNITGALKRKADSNIDNNVVTKKRSVLGDVTNAIEKTISQGRKEVQKLSLPKKTRTTAENVNRATLSSLAKRKVVNATKPAVTKSNKFRGLSAATGKLASVTDLPKVKLSSQTAETDEDAELHADMSYCEALPSSQELKLTLDSSNYVTASEASPLLSSQIGNGVAVLESVTEETAASISAAFPEGVVDYDKECEMDPFAVALYATDIFNYYKQRESKFTIEKYIHKQPEMTESMRSILVDWMVEVQESFELNHETLYLAVKLVDLFLSKQVICRDQLQLVGSTALFIACKFDERVPPYVDDFLYICDDAYKRKEIIAYEIKMLKAVGFDLGIPLSYRYLRRYARCAKVSMEELTLSRYILEMSLMEYELLDASDSAVAAAALLLARCMHNASNSQPWTPTLQHYSGFAVEDLYHLVHVLHAMLAHGPRDHLKTVRNKYSHEVFYEVAKIPVPDTLNL